MLFKSVVVRLHYPLQILISTKLVHMIQMCTVAVAVKAKCKYFGTVFDVISNSVFILSF